jgi:tetratricopeptide (TPR) repeat protein
MHQYGVREVEKLIHLPRSTIRAFIEAGFVSPVRGPRKAWLFSFQDLIVLRTAQALATANVPPKRIARSVKALRDHLPDSMPLSGLSITAVADHVVVKEGGSRWQADSGQYLLAFEGDPSDGSLSVIEAAPTAADDDAASWLYAAIALEDEDTEAATEAYRRAVAADPTLLDAQINLGWLLHDAGRLSEAEQVYRAAIEACGADPALMYNFGVLLHDMNRGREAVEAYESALQSNPDLADAHYNLALLYEELKQPKAAIRHMARYRKLIGRKPR